MERLEIKKPKNYRRNMLMAAALGLGALISTGCSWNDLNPAESVSHGADAGAGATQEILVNYPDATNIQVTHANDNPNYMTWDLPDGEVCTALASATHNRGATPGRLITEPYCRPIAAQG